MRNGDNPRTLDALANINSFAVVGLHGAKGERIEEAYVDNFGRYFLANVPVRRDLELRVEHEGSTSVRQVRREANLVGAVLHRIDLVTANTAPVLEPLVPRDATGADIQVAQPGDTIRIDASARDDDGDDLRVKWIPGPGSGSVSAEFGPTTVWTLPANPGRYTIRAHAFDGKGGYATAGLSIEATTKGVKFSGVIDAVDSPGVAGVEVEINGTRTVTEAGGLFHTRVEPANRYVLNLREPGYAFQSRIYDGPVEGGRWTLFRASVHSADPTRDIDLSDQRDPRNCVGPASQGLSWKQFPNAMIPVWQDGKSKVIVGEKELPVALSLSSRDTRECGPGIRVRIPGNSLVDEAGLPPPGMVEVELATVDLRSPEQMPGDWTANDMSGTQRVMRSFGAGMVEIRSGDREYNLKPGSSAEVLIPVAPELLATPGVIPPSVPLLFYDEVGGVWNQEGTAFLSGTVYVANVTHFSAINTDELKDEQACVRVLSPSLPSSYQIEIHIPQTDGSAPEIRTAFVDNSSPSEHVIYNLPTNTNIVLVPIRIDSDVPLGMFVVNTGGAQNPTTPNLPAGPPYVACSTEVTLTDIPVPEEPLAEQFLQGLTTFRATNLSELDPADPLDSDLIAALDQTSDDYYKQIDPRSKRLTLTDFQNVNGFGGSTEVSGIYANSGDLGFGREMYMVRNGDDVAAYVTNYGDIATDDLADAINAGLGDGPVATVAMEYSRIENQPGLLPEFDDDERVVKFYVYNADGSARLNAAELDAPIGSDVRARPIPQLCMVCHGGEYSGEVRDLEGDVPGDPGFDPTAAVPTFADREDVKLGSKFLPFDLNYFTLWPDGTLFDQASQEGAFKSMNEGHVAGVPPDPAMEELIAEMYPGGATTQDLDLVVPGWDGAAIDRDTYRGFVEASCRTCHLGNHTTSLQFRTAAEMINRLGSVENRVCAQYVMPHAKVTYQLMWGSASPHFPAQLQTFGDTYGTSSNGWNGSICGEFTAGGSTPVSPYYADVQPIWDLNCTACHTGGSPPAGLDLTVSNSYDDLVGVGATQSSLDRVEPGDPANSYLVDKIEGTQSTGDQMPQGCSDPSGTCLPVADRTTITNWISSGADE